jgi:hypothetical protein
VTTEGGPDFVPPAARIATFDNDGTLWAEQPLYFQFLLALDRVKVLAPQHSEWKDQEPFASLLKGDLKGALAGGEHALLEIVAATHASMTSEEFDKVVKDWLATARHPKTGRPYTTMAYQPMLELLTYLLCTRMGSKPSLSLAAAWTSCARLPSKSMAFLPSRSLVARAN